MEVMRTMSNEAIELAGLSRGKSESMEKITMLRNSFRNADSEGDLSLKGFLNTGGSQRGTIVD